MSCAIFPKSAKSLLTLSSRQNLLIVAEGLCVLDYLSFLLFPSKFYDLYLSYFFLDDGVL